LLFYAQQHHPSMSGTSIRTLFSFTYSLWNRQFFLRFQNLSALSQYNMIDVPNHCVRASLRALNVPNPFNHHPSAQMLVKYCTSSKIPFVYLPGCSRDTLRQRARVHPNSLIFNSKHCVTFALVQGTYNAFTTTF